MIVLSKKLLIVLALLLLLLTALFLFLVPAYHLRNGNNDEKMHEKLHLERPPDIISIKFDGKASKNGWVEVGSTVVVRIKLKGPATMVELYITPVGTSTYREQKLIGIAFARNGIAEYVWEVPENTMGHFHIIAYNKDVGRKSHLVNVIRQGLR